jgi:hypothetical protein
MRFFRWVAVGTNECAAIVVPVTLNGRDYDFQLDTGAEASYIPEARAVEAGLMKAEDDGARVQDVRIGGTPIGPRWMLTRGTTGTLGLDMLVGFTTVIDYPAQRLCVTPTADLPFSIYRRTRWTDAVLRHGKLFVPVTVGNELRTEYFFDTGASLFPLSVDGVDWKALTGRVQVNERDGRISGMAWGKKVELAGAPSLLRISIGSLPPKPLEVFTDLRMPSRFSDHEFCPRPLRERGAVGQDHRPDAWRSSTVRVLQPSE